MTDDDTVIRKRAPASDPTVRRQPNVPSASDPTVRRQPNVPSASAASDPKAQRPLQAEFFAEVGLDDVGIVLHDIGGTG